MRGVRPSRLASVCAALLLSIVLFACGGSGAGLPSLPEFTPGSVSDTDRDNAINDVKAYFDTVVGNAQAAELMVDKMKSMPIFATAEVSASGDAIGWFKDGRQLAVFTSDDLPPAGTSHTLQTQPATTSTATRKNLTNGLKAYLINALEPARTDASAALTPLLQQKGYNVTTMAGTIDDFKSLTDVSLLLVHAHGLVSTDKHRVQHFYYATSQKPDALTNGQYSADWDNDSLMVGIGPVWDSNGKTHDETKYCISEQFLINHGLNFVPNAFWMSQSCSSYSTPILNVALGGGSTGVATYAGWDSPTDNDQSTATVNFVFDRLLGLNSVAPVEQETPPPYDFAKLRTALANTVRPGGTTTFDRSGASKFLMKSASGSTVQTIIPAITDTTVNVDNNTLTIKGYFGSAPGSVTLDGSILPQISWSETSVVVQKPNADSGTLVLRSLGTSSPNGYLLSQPYAYKGIGVDATPQNPVLDLGQHQTFTAAVTNGTMPQGGVFKWTLTGKGKINGGTTVTTASTTVAYVAPNESSVDTLKVQIVVNGVAIAEKTLSVVVGSDTQIDFTLSGNWDSSKTPANGHYFYSGGQGSRYSPEVGIDALGLGYDIGTADQTIGVLVSVVLTPGQALEPGLIFNHFQSGTFGPGMYQLTMATNQSNPDDPNSNQYAIGTNGTLTIDSVATLPDGNAFIHYSFNATNGIGGTITGTGTAEIVVTN